MKESKESISMGANDIRDGTNITKLERNKPIVLSSEIMNLSNLKAYVKPAGNFAIALSKIKYKDRKNIAESFIRYKQEEDEDNKENNDNSNNSFLEDSNMYGVQMKGNYEKKEMNLINSNIEEIKNIDKIKLKPKVDNLKEKNNLNNKQTEKELQSSIQNEETNNKDIQSDLEDLFKI